MILTRLVHLFPTCDNAHSPGVKAVVHGVTVAAHLLIACYHARSVAFHLGHWLAVRRASR